MCDGDKMILFVRLFYGSPSTCLWEDDSGKVHHVQQGEEGEQGDPLMPLLISLGMHRSASASQFGIGEVMSQLEPPSSLQ